MLWCCKDNKPKIHRAKEVSFYDYQFFDEDVLRPLLEKERGIVRTEDNAGNSEKVEFIAKEVIRHTSGPCNRLFC